MTRTLTLPSRVSTLALAAAIAAGPSPAAAQSLLGTPSVFSGSANVTEGTGTTNVTVSSPQAVIDWTPDDNAVGNFGAIAFQNQGTTATFSSSSDFAVLNRINVADNSRSIFMDGTINSLVNGQTGGSVYFYSPSGFVMGPHSLVNVGSLVLSASPILVDGNGSFVNNGTVVFGQALNPLAAIVTVSDLNGTSQINALNESSYVALVAPRVEHHGNIAVNGAAALVGAEAATITFRPSGLFDIQVDVGTTDGEGVAIDGSIGGPASSGSGDFHRVYAVAVPKNTALTMAISGGASLGFDVAQAADTVGNTVVLSAGHDVFFGGAEFDPSPASGAAANIDIRNSTVTSAMSADATGNIDLSATAGQAMKLFSDANLRSSGGYIHAVAFGSDALLDIDGNLSANVDRFGQSNGESVTAGEASLYAQTGGTVNLDGNLNISANGYGGQSSVAGVDAGDGTGGTILVQAEGGSSLNIGGSIFATADGFGGYPGVAGANAGKGKGGFVFMGTFGNDASFGVGSTVTATANGSGGNGDGGECFLCDGLGGAGTGGTVSAGTQTGTGSIAFFGDAVQLIADGDGGRSVRAGSTSATGTGGTVHIYSSGGSQVEGFGLTFASDLTASANGQGGESSTTGIGAGLGDGGLVVIQATANSTLGISGDLEVDADGTGGHNDFGVDGGDGLGGEVYLSASDGNSLVSVAGTADLEADGEGSFNNSDCIGCGGIGGDGTGGTVHIFGGSGTNNRVEFASTLDLSAQGFGGIGVTGTAGTGKGGTASFNVAAGLTMTVGNLLAIEADGQGGLGFDGQNGGAGIGGTAAIYGNGGSLTATTTSVLQAGAFGGAGSETGGNGGAATGGVAQIYAPSGSLQFNGSLFLNGESNGGNAPAGIGGSALGGNSWVQTNGGTIHVAGNLFLDGGAIGGDGLTGGNATGDISLPENEGQQTAVMITADNNGSIDVDGTTIMSAEGVGGNGSNGNGGNGQAGEADVIVFFGSIDLNSLSIDTNGYGGNGGLGGNGGSGTGGPVDVTFGLGGAAIGGTIALGSATITADGEGGAGGTGAGGNTGGDGGDGGDGTGARITFAGTASGGSLVAGSSVLTSLGRGGAGGAGGNGDTGTGGNGGNGGIGTGGAIQTGTLSAEAAPTIGGGATHSFLSEDTSGYGGTGGDGGTGGGGNGVGGNGGEALGGSSVFLARGVLVTADTVLLNANATGGDGGAGSIQGDGGNATTGVIQVESKDRFGHADQRGTLQVDSVVGSAIASGGFGATNGTATAIGNSYIRVLNGDATIGSIDFTIDGDVYDPTFVNSTVSVRDGTATVGDLSFVTIGDLALDASNGSMTADTITVSAGNFVPDAFSGAQVGPGTYTAGSFSITTGNNFITNANLDSGSALSLLAPGLISARNISSDTSVFGRANGTFTAGTIDAGTFVDIRSNGTFTAGAIDAGTFIDIRSNGLLSLGTLNAGDYIDLRTANGIQMADATSGETIYILTGGLLTGGDLTAGNTVAAQGALGITLGNLSAGIVDPSSAPGALYRVGLGSNGAISVGDIVALGDIGMGTAGTATTGNLTSGGGILALVGGDMQFGSMTSDADGYIYLADSSMSALGGTFDNFDRAPVLAATPVRSSGSIAIGGPVSTGRFQAAAGTTLTAQSITAPLGIYLDAGGAILTGALSSDDDIDATSDGSIQTGAIASTLGSATLTANGSVATGAITAGGQVQLTSATANISTGNIDGPGGILLDSVTGVATGDISSDAAITIVNGGSILTGDISSTGGAIFLQSDVDIVTGAVTTPFDAEFDALGNISLTGNANVGGYLFADAGGNLAMASATAGQSIDVIAGGTILGANMTAGDSVIARSGGAVTLGNLSAGLVNPSTNPVDGQIVGIGSLTSVSVGNVAAADFVGLTSDGGLNAGTVQSGGDVMVLADGPSTIGAITSNVEGRTYVAGFAMLDVGGGFEDFDPSLVYAAANPVPTAGSFTVNGSIVTGQLDAYVGGAMSLGPVQAGLINARVGGLASINGLWQAPNVELWSSDIAIAANGGIDAGNFGAIRLVSTNGTQALIGDGLSGSGYALSNGEFSRLSSGTLEIAARSDASAGIDMLIGDLSITGPLAGSTIDDPNGYVAFATGDPNTQQAGGVIRIVGEVRATGFDAGNSLDFATGRFELDAQTGLVEITSNGTDLSGELGLYADQIHVAEGSILDQLAADPQYDGYRDDLNAPASVQRPEGVLKAATIWIESGNLQDVLIQNTGTADTPAGFLAQQTFINDDFEVAGPLGSIDLVVNGQLQTEGGVLTGVAVRDAAVEGEDLTPFTANSMINGCLLSGGCGQVSGPLPPDFTPTPDIQQEIVLLGENEPAPPPFGNEDQIDNGEEDEEAETSPIVPPEPLFDTTELGEAEGTGNPAFNTTMRSHPGLVEEGEVDDPVSGSGNPALMEDSTPTSNEEKQP